MARRLVGSELTNANHSSDSPGKRYLFRRDRKALAKVLLNYNDRDLVPRDAPPSYHQVLRRVQSAAKYWMKWFEAFLNL